MLPLPSLTWPQNIGTNIKRAWAAKCQLYRSTAGGGRGKGQGASACWSWLQFELFETISLKTCDTISNDDDKKSQQPSRLSLSLSPTLPHSLSLSHTSLLALSLSVSVSCWLFQGLGQTGVCQLQEERRLSRLSPKLAPQRTCVCVCVYVWPPLITKAITTKALSVQGCRWRGGGGGCL